MEGKTPDSQPGVLWGVMIRFLRDRAIGAFPCFDGFHGGNMLEQACIFYPANVMALPFFIKKRVDSVLPCVTFGFASPYYFGIVVPHMLRLSVVNGQCIL